MLKAPGCSTVKQKTVMNRCQVLAYSFKLRRYHSLASLPLLLPPSPRAQEAARDAAAWQPAATAVFLGMTADAGRPSVGRCRLTPS